MGIYCADHAIPFYPQKLALTSPTSDDRSVGIVRLRSKATEFSLVSEHVDLMPSEDGQLTEACEGNKHLQIETHWTVLTIIIV
jgi:hypothetical protein